MYQIYLNTYNNASGINLGFLRYDPRTNKTQITQAESKSYEGRLAPQGNYLSYQLYFNGIDYEFCYIENFLRQAMPLIQNGLKSSDETQKSNIERLVSELKDALSGKTIIFDYHQNFIEHFDKFVELFGRTTYFKNKFRSTNGSNRVLSLIKF